MELWGAGGRIIKGFCDALAPYKVTLQNVQLAASMANAADNALTVNVGKTVVKFSFQKIEVMFPSFGNEDEFQGMPKFLEATTGWLVRDLENFKYATHDVAYFSHSFLRGLAADDYLRNLNPRKFDAAGFDLGSGLLLNSAVPEKKWTTHLSVDRSQQISGALFIGLRIEVEGPIASYDSFLLDGRTYFEQTINELGLRLDIPQEGTK